MARGTTLEELVTMLRAEVGASLSQAQGQNVNAAFEYNLRQMQEFLYQDFAWPHLRVIRDKTLQAGQRYYSYPEDLSFDRLEGATFRETGTTRSWRKVEYGITDACFNTFDSDLAGDDPGQRDAIVRRWQTYENNQLEVWPVPSENGGILRLRGMKALARLTAAQDRADLDDQLIVLFTAAQYLERQKLPNARSKAQLAQALYDRLKGNSQKAGIFPLQAVSDRGPAQPSITVRAPGT